MRQNPKPGYILWTIIFTGHPRLSSPAARPSNFGPKNLFAQIWTKNSCAKIQSLGTCIVNNNFHWPPPPLKNISYVLKEYLSDSPPHLPPTWLLSLIWHLLGNLLKLWHCAFSPKQYVTKISRQLCESASGQRFAINLIKIPVPKTFVTKFAIQFIQISVPKTFVITFAKICHKIDSHLCF